MIRINLHIHSTCSDGAFPPSELACLLHKHKVAVASLTDHDTVDGVMPFLSGCHRFNIRGVPGIELSSTSPKGELHILGYRFDLDSPGLGEVLAQYRNARRKRNWEICERLRRLGISISMEDIEAHARGIVGRPHIAQALWERGYALSIRDAFSRYLGRGGSAYVSRSPLSTEDAIRVIREARGLPVWAHPLSSLTDPKDFEPVLDRLKEMGLWGVECWFHGAEPMQTWRCLNEAERRKLYTTAGTDFHGRPEHTAKISGCLVRDDLLPWARFCGWL